MTEGEKCERKDCSSQWKTAQYALSEEIRRDLRPDDIVFDFNDCAPIITTKGEKMFGRNNDQKPDFEYFSVYDSKAQTYTEPFPATNKEVVIRDFMNAFRDPQAPTKNKYFMNAEDFVLFKVANFHVKTGAIQGVNPEHVINMHELRAIATPRPEVPGIVPT